MAATATSSRPRALERSAKETFRAFLAFISVVVRTLGVAAFWCWSKQIVDIRELKDDISSRAHGGSKRSGEGRGGIKMTVHYHHEGRVCIVLTLSGMLTICIWSVINLLVFNLCLFRLSLSTSFIVEALMFLLDEQLQ